MNFAWESEHDRGQSERKFITPVLGLFAGIVPFKGNHCQAISKVVRLILVELSLGVTL